MKFAALLIVVVLGAGTWVAVGSPQPWNESVGASAAKSGPASGSIAAELADGLPTGKEVVISEADLNHRIAEAMNKASAYSIDGVQVSLRADGKVDVTGTTSLGGGDTQFSARLAMASKDGVLDVVIEDARAGVVPLPAVVISQLAEKAAAAAGLPGLKGIKLPAEVRAIQVRRGELVLLR